MDAGITIPTTARKRGSRQPTGRTGPGLGLVLAVAALHFAAIWVLCLVFRTRDALPAPSGLSIPVVFVPTPSPAPDNSPQSLASSTLARQTDTETLTIAPLRPLFLPPGKPFLLSRPARPQHRKLNRVTSTPAAPRDLANPAVSSPSPPASASRAQAAPTQPETPTADTRRAMARWEARIQQAVQDAAVYPPSARLLHREGSAQVRFDYDRGSIKSVSIVHTTYVGALDNAALAAVTRAAIPNPPAELGPQKHTMLVWVRFRLM